MLSVYMGDLPIFQSHNCEAFVILVNLARDYDVFFIRMMQ